MALWRLYYHLIWGTKNRQPLINGQREARLYPYIISKADSLNSIIHAINGTENHIHVIVSIPPKLAIADFVKRIKGSSSHYLNQNFPLSPQFVWQEGYGVFSLGGKQLDTAIAYVQNQKIHHQQNTVISLLEQIDHNDDPPKPYCSLSKPSPSH
ncbi:Transposase IS200-like protein [Stanieria sp. NIES-3757]|nr:Transposase IS200-like protein [Stanieria sp. NIES-3757]